MTKITGQLFIRAETETEYRPWDELTKKEAERISEYLNREAARAGGFRKVNGAA